MISVKSLVIGYGNSLRSDDAIGIEVAKIVASWHLPNVRSLALHQLTPELAVELVKVELAIFVDASEAANSDVVELHALKPSTSLDLKSHFSDPKALLGLTQALFGKSPQAWWVIVPGVDFQLGDRLTPTAQQGIEQASNEVKNLLNTMGKVRTTNYHPSSPIGSKKTENHARSQYDAKYFRYCDRSSTAK
ncbi:hydrogenase maturation protease [Pleurocapsales cyanobacterium LEGE 10410]|nr:hydrogenase maturation protease [Pleurocapsales cyanobacterium LEGE 10410]